MTVRTALVLLVGLVASVLAPPGRADAQPTIASHRAAYVLSLGSARSNANIASIEGGMFIDWHEECEGWIISQRMRFQIVDGDGETVDSEINFSSWEAHDGLSYRFTMRTTRDGEVTEELRGRAQLEGQGKGGKALFSSPENLEIELPAGTLFPTMHSLLLLKHAAAGDASLSRIVFDGATQDGALEVNAFLGAKLPPDKLSNAKIARLADVPSWRVRMAFFKPGEPSSEPEYETGMRMLENGVGTEFLFDYGEFSIRAKLDSLQELPKPRC